MDVARGQALALLGVALFAVSMVASAALAPSIGAVEGDSVETYVGVQGGGTGWHQYGRVTMYEGTDVAWQGDAADSYFDVTELENGSLMVGFMDGDREACGPYEAPCSRTGYQIVEPGSGEVLAEYSFPVRTSKNSEVHVAEPLPSGEVLMADMDRERVFTVEDGTVTWQWNASQLYDAPEDPTRTDWLHINDVDVIGEDRYLVSVRNANQLLVIERGAGVVEVVNEDTDDENDGSCRGQLRDTDGDGEIRCGDPEVLDHQHNPQWLDEGAVLVADSDNNRVVELHRTDGGWEPAWTLESAGGAALQWPRDADRLPNGNTLITDTLNRRIVEINESGRVVWSVRTRYVPYEADRRPHGEPDAPLPRYEDGQATDPGGSIPGLSLGLVGLRSVWPGLPFWFRELQLLATLVSLGLVAAGGVDHWRNG